MSKSDIAILKEALRKWWFEKPSAKVARYIDQFFETTRTGTKIVGKVRGNHGIYTVSIHLQAESITSSCSCYIGKEGFCHHCAALAHTFLHNDGMFKEIQPKTVENVRSLRDVPSCLRSVTLDALLKELKTHGISQKAFAESIGMSTRHLSAIKSSELRNQYFHELGAIKLACLWVLEHLVKKKETR